jgi:phosphate transport system ATP-binding protein
VDRTARHRRRRSRLFTAITALATAAALAPLASLLVFLAVRGARAVGTLPSLAPALAGSALLLAVACGAGVPLGLAAGLYLHERRGTRAAALVRYLCDVLVGVPSVVLGVVAWLLLVRPSGHFSAWAGGGALAAAVLPLVARTTDDVLALVPPALGEAALALGYGRWRATLTVVLRAAAPGVLTGVLAATARVAGETAPPALHRPRQPVLVAAPQRTGGRAPAADLRRCRQRRPGHPRPRLRRRARARLRGGRVRRCRSRCCPPCGRARGAPARPAPGPLAHHPLGRGREHRPMIRFAAPFPPAARLAVEGLRATYGGRGASARVAIDDVTLAFPDRQVTAVIGPSGCGKSTLLRCLNRLHETVPGAHAAGCVLLDGRDARTLAPSELRRRVGMVFQRPTPFPGRSVRDNVAAGLAAQGGRAPRGPDLDAVVERALRRAALWDEVRDRLGDDAGRLSGGQQQRLCVARALAQAPDVLLLDEPTAALDPLSAQKVEELVYALRRR